MKHTRLLRRCRTRPIGFTLVESLFALAILGLLFAGTFDMYGAAMRTTSKNGAQASTTQRAAVALERVIDDSRESYALALPTDASGFTPPVGSTTAGQYCNTDGSAAALQLTAPTTAAITVNTSSASSTVNVPTYNKSSTAALTIYRSDSAGNPAPNTGQYLWESGTPPGQSALPAGGIKIAELGETAAISATIADAVKFVRTASSSATAPAIEVTLITSDYSAIGGHQNNESTSSTLTGKCVFLRNHP